MENRKRKRDPEDGAPRIKYHVEQLGRSFERIFKEKSLEELRDVVRKKLKLDDNTRPELVQLREGRAYDLEDDDDFEAFRAVAVEYSSLDVRVSYSSQDITIPGHSSVSFAAGTSASHEASTGLHKDREKQKRRLSAPEQNTQDNNIDRSPNADGAQKMASSGDEEDDMLPPPKKRRKTMANVVAVEESGVPKPKKKNARIKDPDPVLVDQEQEPEPPKKKRKQAKGAESSAPPEDATPVAPVETASTGNKSIPRKGMKVADVDVEASPGDAPKAKRTKNKDVQPTATETSTTNASSIPPSLQSFLSEVVKRRPSRTAEEIADLYYGPTTDAAAEPSTARKNKTQEKDTTASTKKETGEKKKARVRKSRLSESWVPEDLERHLPNVPQPEASSSSVRATQPLSVDTAEVPTANILPAATATATTVIPVPASHSSRTPRTKPQNPPRSPNKTAAPCPVCLSQQFHFQFLCPIIQSGGPAIRTRIAELETEGGWEDLIKDLGEWVKRADRKGMKEVPEHIEEVTIADSNNSSGLKSVFPWVPKAGHGIRPSVSVSERTSIGPQDGQLSEVTVEGRDEGSEGEESSTSDSNSSSSSEDKGKGKKTDTKTESKSDSESGSESGSSPELSTGLTTNSLGMNLAGMDLEALIRGPELRLGPEDIVDEDENENESDSIEDDEGFLEEDEEQAGEKRTRRSKGWKEERSSSPEGVGDDDESEAEETPKDSMIADDVIASADVDATRTPGEKSIGTNPDPPPSAEAETPLARESELQKTSAPDTPLVPQEVDKGSTEVDALPGRLQTPPADEPSPSKVLPPTTPSKPPSSRVAPHSRSPIVPQMKDRHGTLPLNPPDDEIGTAMRRISPDRDDIPPGAVEEEAMIEPSKRGRSRAPSPQAKSTVPPARSRSRTAAPSTSPAASTPSDGVPKRRGRPPLTEAVKAERKAIKDAEKAARAAEKRAKAEEKKKTPVARKPRKQKNDPEIIQSGSDDDSPSVSTPIPISQWKTMAPATSSSAVSRSSPPIDQLMTSSPFVQLANSNVNSEEVALPGKVDGIKSPGAISVTTSTSRRLDEDDVEQIVGSLKASEKHKTLPPLGQSLFLPGASQMTQSQTIPKFATLAASEQKRSDSGSSSNTEAECEKDERTPQKPSMPRPVPSSKLTFPSISTMSFDKFRPNFLLPGRGFSQNKAKEQDAQLSDEESESEDEESSDEEKQSHIPKGRVAGASIVRKRKSRGLLQA